MVKLLLVDDNDSLRSMLKLYLRDPAISDVVEAGSGDEAIVIAAEEGPDVVVCDCRMPGMNGDDAGRRIRELLPNAHIVSYSGTATDKPWADEVIVKGGAKDLQRLKSAVLESIEDD